MNGWLKKHSDTIVTLGVLFGMITWLSSVFSKINDRFIQINERFNKIEKDIAIIKTVLVMKEILPKEIAAKIEKEE